MTTPFTLMMRDSGLVLNNIGNCFDAVIGMALTVRRKIRMGKWVT